MNKSLAARMKALVEKEAPSMVPRYPEDRREEEAPLKDVNEVAPDMGSALRIKQLVAQSVRLQQDEAEVKKARKPITTELKSLVSSCDANRFLCQGVRVAMYTTTRRTLNPHKLMANGVPAELIEKCMDETESSTLRLSAPGMEED